VSDHCFSVQQAGFLLELSGDWIVLRASENVHKFLGEYHVRMVGEPLAKFTLAQPLHDLRNSLSRQRSARGIARAYRVRLTAAQTYLDISFQQLDGRYLLEGVISAESFGASMGTISRLLEGIGSCDEAAIARRMRALCGFDRVLLVANDGSLRADCSRSSFAPRGFDGLYDLPPIIADVNAEPTPVHPRSPEAGACGAALMRAPSAEQTEKLKRLEVRSMLNLPVIHDGLVAGIFSCDSQSPISPCFETHAAAELFAQVCSMQHDG
jgi:light-regulated signal transduction histidine kinase (bacteriophytochrome)